MLFSHNIFGLIFILLWSFCFDFSQDARIFVSCWCKHVASVSCVCWCRRLLCSAAHPSHTSLHKPVTAAEFYVRRKISKKVAKSPGKVLKSPSVFCFWLLVWSWNSTRVSSKSGCTFAGWYQQFRSSLDWMPFCRQCSAWKLWTGPYWFCWYQDSGF